MPDHKDSFPKAIDAKKPTIKWKLKWCLASEDHNGYHYHDTEIFDTKDAMIEKIEELKEKHDQFDGLEFTSGPAKKILIPKWVFLSKEEISKLQKDEIAPKKMLPEQTRIDDFVS